MQLENGTTLTGFVDKTLKAWDLCAILPPNHPAVSQKIVFLGTLEPPLRQEIQKG